MTVLDRLSTLRWPEGVRCPFCGDSRYYTHEQRPIFGCANPACRKQFSPTTGTVFHHRKLEPERLALAFEVFGECAGPADLMRALGVQYKSAHSLWRRLLSTDGRLA